MLTGDYLDQTFTGKLITACRTHDFHPLETCAARRTTKKRQNRHLRNWRFLIRDLFYIPRYHCPLTPHILIYHLSKLFHLLNRIRIRVRNPVNDPAQIILFPDNRKCLWEINVEKVNNIRYPVINFVSSIR